MRIVRRSLHAGLEHQFELVALEVADAAVNQARGATTGPAAKVVLLDHSGVEAPHRCIAGHGDAGDAAADDQQVELLLAEALDVLLAGSG